MATAKIDILGPNDLGLITQLYNQIFQPARDLEFFERRFRSHYNGLILTATLDDDPVGFALGFELKPAVFFSWLLGVLPDCRRTGVGSQLMDAKLAWARDHGYESIRVECQNGHRAMLHMVIERNYDVMGVRWDPDRGENLVIVEKVIEDE